MQEIKDLVQDFVKQMTILEKISLLSTHQSAIPRLGIQEYHVGGEAAHGVVDRTGESTTLFPLPIGMAQTWNPELIHEMGFAIGNEARIKYYQSGKSSWLTLWAPTIDLVRDSRWGRNEEGYGEDPYLTSTISTAFIKGMQTEKDNRILMSAAPKHFFCNNNEMGRENTSNFIPLRVEREYYLLPFKSAIEKGAATSMMTAYNGINGIPGMQLPELQKIVRDEWQMEGFIVCDGGALSVNVEQYHYYDSYEEALADSIKKGVDCFVDDKELVENAVKRALEKGLINENDINRAITRSLTVRAKLGHFDRQDPFSDSEENLLNSEQHSLLSSRVMEEQVVLLKNEANQLPIKESDKILVVGPLIDTFMRDWYQGYHHSEITIKQGFSELLGENVSFDNGHQLIHLKHGDRYLGIVNQTLTKVTEPYLFQKEQWDKESFVLKDIKTQQYLVFDDETKAIILNKSEIFDWFVKERFVLKENQLINWQGETVNFIGSDSFSNDKRKTAKIEIEVISSFEDRLDFSQINQVIVCLGNHPMFNAKETLDRDSFDLFPLQEKLLKYAVKHHSNVTLVLSSGYPFNLEWAKENVPSILYTATGCQNFGSVLAEVIVGKRMPSGKLAQSWFKDTKNLPLITNYDLINYPRTYHYLLEGIVYPFGYGLSYQSFEIETFSLLQETSHEITFAVTIYNPSQQLAVDTVQLYLRVNDNSRLLTRLIAFKKVFLSPNESKKIILTVDKNQLTYFDVRTEKYVEFQSPHEIVVGFNSQDIIKSIQMNSNNTNVESSIRNVKHELNIFSFDHYLNIDIQAPERNVRELVLLNNGWVEYLQNSFAFEKYELTLRVFENTFVKVNDREYELEPGIQKLDIFVEPTANLRISTNYQINVLNFMSGGM